MTIRSDVQSLTPGSLIEVFVLDSTNIPGGGIYRFHNGVNELGNDVVWQGATYTRFPVEASGFEWNGQGTLPRPRVKVANVTGIFGALVKSLDDLIGAKLTRKRTFLKYLDAVNFAGSVNATADPNAHFPDEVWFVDRKSHQDKIFMEFELASATDLQGVMVPSRQVIQNICGWLSIGGYRGPYCGYTGGPVADLNDQPTTNSAQDACGGRLTSCRLRFGTNAQLPFGGFPAAGLTR